MRSSPADVSRRVANNAVSPEDHPRVRPARPDPRKVHMPLFRQRQTLPASNNVLIYRFVQLYPLKMGG
jgi:hypothetical protein